MYNRSSFSDTGTRSASSAAPAGSVARALLDGMATLTAAARVEVQAEDERAPLMRVVHPADEAAEGRALFWQGTSEMAQNGTGGIAIRFPFLIALGRPATLTLVPGPRSPAARVLRATVDALLPSLALALVESGRPAERPGAAGLVHAVQALTVGLILLAPDGRIDFANREAERLLAGDHGLSLRSGRVSAARLHDAFRLSEALGHVAGGQPSAVLSLARGGQRPLMLTILSARDGAEGLEPNDRQLVMWLLDPMPAEWPMVQRVCEMMGMTPAETSLVGHIMKGSSVDEAAAALKIKASTARSYLRNVFCKVDCGSQADLIATLLRACLRVSLDPFRMSPSDRS